MRRRLVPIRTSEPLGDRRSGLLVEAARELLAERDYEAFSVAELARRAGCSVGAFYGRHPDKDGFLATVIWRTFHEAKKRAEAEFNGLKASRLSVPSLAQHVARIVSNEMSEVKTAGVTRAAIKLSATDPAAAKPLLDYRAMISARAAALLSTTRKEGAKERAKEGVQIAFAILIDSILLKSGPLKPGSRKMAETLEAVLARHFALKQGAD